MPGCNSLHDKLFWRDYGMRIRVRWALAALAVTGLAACEGEPTGFSGQVSVRRFIASVYAVVPGPGGAAQPAAKADVDQAAVAATDPVLVPGTLRGGLYPTAPAGPGATVILESSIVTGMPAKLRVNGDAPFTRVAITVVGADDHWEIVLPAPVLSVQVVPTGSSSMPNTSFSLEVAVGTDAGYGRPERPAVQAVDLASSDVAVILRWNAASDVDLHVTDGKGAKVYFANPRTAEGGQLDLDSNPACNIDGVNQEVITWPLNKAPAGEYKVEVDYWSDCGVPRSDYAVTLMVRGRILQVINGHFEGVPGPAGTHEVARFTIP
jgi:hypothetical protein